MHHTVQTPPLPHVQPCAGIIRFGECGSSRGQAHPVLHLRALLHAFDRNASWDVLYAHGGLHLVHVLTACVASAKRVGMPSATMAGRAHELISTPDQNHTIAH